MCGPYQRCRLMIDTFFLLNEKKYAKYASMQEALSSRRSGLAQCILFWGEVCKYAGGHVPPAGMASAVHIYFLGGCLQVCGRPHSPAEMG